jgi:hypothetical protein
MKTKNVTERAKIIQQIVEHNYEVGNQSKSKINIYRNVILKSWHISERTFWRYLELRKIEKLK